MTNVELTSADGLALEAVLSPPESPSAALVLCHPHPQMGGTMNAPLLIALEKTLVQRGLAVLRFNFRGIGRSEGHASTGLEEVEDAQAAVSFLRARYPELPVAIAGWSFGAAVAVRTAVADDSLAGCVAIAPAVEEKPGITAGLPAPSEAEIDVPLMLVCAANDHLVPCDGCIRWADAARADHHVVPGANHFFWGKYDRLSRVVADFLERVL